MSLASAGSSMHPSRWVWGYRNRHSGSALVATHLKGKIMTELNLADNDAAVIWRADIGTVELVLPDANDDDDVPEGILLLVKCAFEINNKIPFK